MKIIWKAPLTNCWCGFTPTIFPGVDSDALVSVALYHKHVAVHSMELCTERLRQAAEEIRRHTVGLEHRPRPEVKADPHLHSPLVSSRSEREKREGHMLP